MRTKLLATSVVALASGCASIVSESTWPLEVTATPAETEVEIRNEEGQVVHKGRTPFTVALGSGAGYFDGETYTLRATAAGHQPAQATVDTRMNGWYFGNILFGGLIGLFIVDPATGAMWKLPKTAHIDLSPDPAAPKP